MVATTMTQQQRRQQHNVGSRQVFLGVKVGYPDGVISVGDFFRFLQLADVVDTKTSVPKLLGVFAISNFEPHVQVYTCLYKCLYKCL